MAVESKTGPGQTATSQHEPNARVSSRDSWLLVALLMAVHAPLALNHGFYGDDWLLFEAKPGYQTMISFLLHGAGHPITYLYCAMANMSGHPSAVMNAVAFAGIAVGALSLRSFLARLQILTRFEILILVFLVWTFAGFRDWATKITAPYIFSFALLCLGLNLFGIVATSPRPRIGLRLVGLAAIFCSFAVNSMILVFLAGMVAHLWFSPVPDGGRPTFRRFVRSLLRHSDYAVIPAVYWLSTNYFFPKIGPYNDYYRIRIPAFAEASPQMLQFLRWGTWEPALDGIRFAVRSPGAACLSLLLSAGLIALAISGPRKPLPRVYAIEVVGPVVAGILLFIICALPYVSVGIAPTGHFYESRHLLLFGLPLGLLVIGVMRAVRLVSTTALTSIVAALIVSINLCALWNSYFFQQARWLRQSAMIEQLRRGYAEPPAAVFNLEDGFLDVPGHTFFGITEVTGGLHLAWDNRPLFGFTGRNEQPTILLEMDAAMRMEGSPFRNMDLRGPQATIEFSPKLPVLSDHEVALRYYRCLIGACDERDFLDEIATTRVRLGGIKNLVPPGQKAGDIHGEPTALARLGRVRAETDRHE